MTLLPRIPGAAPYRCVQSRWLKIATGLAPGRSSSGKKVRPRNGCTPSKGKKPDVTKAPGTRSGSPPPLNPNGLLLNPANASNGPLCSFQRANVVLTTHQFFIARISAGLGNWFGSTFSVPQTITRRSGSG